MPELRSGRLFIRLLLLACLAGLSGCGDDPHQALLCQRLLAAFAEPGSIEVTASRREEDGNGPGIRIDYRSGDGETHWLLCRFAGAGFSNDRFKLAGVATDSTGELTGVDLHMLRIWLQQFSIQAHGDTIRPSGDGGLPGLGENTVYLLQQFVNAIVPACIYILLALGFNLVYALVRRINLAYGELLTLGAYGAFATVAVFLALSLQAPLIVIPVALLFVLAAGMLYGWLMERLVFLPLRHTGSQAPLIATVGAAIAVQEALRLFHGGRDYWLQPVWSQRWHIAGAHGFEATISAAQCATAFVTTLIAGVVLTVLSRLRFGRQFRACADDLAMARMCGIDTGCIVALSFALAGLLASAGGFIVLLYYGGVSFTVGTLYGLKGLTAAIIGGLGRPRGAIAGGLILALLETLWSGYLAIAWRDVVVFGLLAGVLILRPQGLAGNPGEDREPRIGAPRHH